MLADWLPGTMENEHGTITDDYMPAFKGSGDEYFSGDEDDSEGHEVFDSQGNEIETDDGDSWYSTDTEESSDDYYDD